jgi:hypothetical protein
MDPAATLWFANGVPVRMVYAGTRWRVTDTPTTLEAPRWTIPGHASEAIDGWRFQITDDEDRSWMVEVHRAGDGWHVHRRYR